MTTRTFASRRRLLQASLLCAVPMALAAQPRTARAQAAAQPPSAAQAQPPGPSQPGSGANGALRLLCTGPAGSIPDIVARRYAEQLVPRTASGVVVDNRPGAAGRIAVAALKQAAPDGATLLLAQGAVATIYPYLYERLAYDPVADLQPVSLAAEATLGLAVGPAVPRSVTTLAEFVGWMRANPRLANYASPGVGTLPHLMVAMLAREAGGDWQHVAYPGGPQALVDLTGGRVAALALPEGLLHPHAAAGRLRVLATSGATRSGFLPDVPTAIEQGFPGLVMREWFAFFLPGGAPAAAAAAASQALRQAGTSPALQSALADIGMLAASSTPGELVERIAQERPVWRQRIAATGVRGES